LQLPFEPSTDHTITKAEAAQLVGAFRSAATESEHLSTAFNRTAFDKLLGQAGCAGIRIYRALHTDGTPTMVLVAVDATGQDLAGPEAVFMQNGTNCPPFCAPVPWL